jgi:predicted site-specific integrase-resolvase
MRHEPPYLSPKEVAAQLRMHSQTIYEYLRTGIIKGKQFKKNGKWKIALSEVQRIKNEIGDA